jgi:hypothetical protein
LTRETLFGKLPNWMQNLSMMKRFVFTAKDMEIVFPSGMDRGPQVERLPLVAFYTAEQPRIAYRQI